MTLRTDLTDGDDQSIVHPAQHNAVNAAVLALQAAPSGTAGGDLTGSYPNPTVGAAKITDSKVAAANKDGAAGTPSMRTLGTGAAQAAAGNDSRLSDMRTPSAASVTDAKVAGGAAIAQSKIAGTIVSSVVAGTNVTVDSTDPKNPVVNATGGGGAPLPANSTGASTVTITPDPTTSADSLVAVQVPAASGQAVLAVHRTGDAFLSWLMSAAATFGLFAGDGVIDPIAGGGVLLVGANSAGQLCWSIMSDGGSMGMVVGDTTSTNRGNPLLTLFGLGLQLDFGGPAITAGTGAPAIGGEVGDMYIRKDTPGTPNQWVYACTVAGVAGAATWVGKL